MKINFVQIPDEGLELKETCSPEQLDLDSKDIKFKKPIELLALISKGINTITVVASLKTEAEATCSRCLSNFITKIEKKHRFNYSISKQQDVDISEDIRQELILGYPIKWLCRPDCKGLCSKCGRNLNLGPCGCK
jgi:uncharacterized protein